MGYSSRRSNALQKVIGSAGIGTMLFLGVSGYLTQVRDISQPANEAKHTVWATGSGDGLDVNRQQIGYLDVSGNLSVSGSIISGGATLIAAPSQSSQDERYVLNQGDTMTGALVLETTISIGGVVYTFPVGDGSASGKVLKTDGSGQLSWSADIDTDNNTTYSAGEGIDLTGTVFSRNAALTGTTLTTTGLITTPSLSGATITASGANVNHVPFSFAFANSGTLLSTGSSLPSVGFGFGGRIAWVHCDVDNPADDAGNGTTQIDLNIGATSIFSTAVTIDGTEKVSTTAAAAPAINPATNRFVQGDALHPVIDKAGGNLVANGLFCRGVLVKENVSITQP